MSSNYIADVLEAQDLEKISYSDKIKQNASDYSQFVNSRVDAIVNESFDRKRTAFQKVHQDMLRYMDMEQNANNFKVRNADIERVQGEIKSNNERLKNMTGADIENSQRQFEINEYHYYNKLETLFFLQLFFICILTMGIVVYLQKAGIITTTFAGFLSLLLLAIAIITGIYRYRYTKNTRDTRLWNRRKFGDPGYIKEPTPLKCNADGEVEFNLDDYLPEGLSKCAKNLKNEANEKLDKLEDLTQDSLSEPLKETKESGPEEGILSQCASGSLFA